MWLKVILVAAVAIILLLAAFTLFLFHFMFYRPKRSTKIPKSYVDTPHYKASRAGMALIKTLPCEDVYITSRDGLKLHAYLFPAEQGTQKFVVGIHGYKSYSRPEYGPYIEFYRSLGYSMLLPDDRAHAPSEGKYIGFGVLDRLDCVDWTKYLVERFGPQVEIRLHGVSMGGATVLAASGEAELPQQVKGIVADCGYTSAWNILSYELKEVAHLPVKPFLPWCEVLCRHLAGYDFHSHTPIEQVRHAKVPILFVHGGKDQMVPAFMVQELYDACAAPKKMLLVKEAGHGESIAFAPDEYHQAIRTFFGI